MCSNDALSLRYTSWAWLVRHRVVPSGKFSMYSCPFLLSLLHSSQRELARALIICSHFPHGNEHVITRIARLLLASRMVPELIHEPKNPRLSPALNRNSAAHVVAAGVFMSSTS